MSSLQADSALTPLFSRKRKAEESLCPPVPSTTSDLAPKRLKLKLNPPVKGNITEKATTLRKQLGPTGYPTPPDSSVGKPPKRPITHPTLNHGTVESSSLPVSPTVGFKKPPTLRLSLTIPRPELPNAAQKRSAAASKAAAKRFASKLQNPYPSRKEIQKAPNLKLLRSYPSQDAVAEKDPVSVDLVIQKSSRVASLLKSFPKLQIFTPQKPTLSSLKQGLETAQQLLANKYITGSKEAEKLAWRNFSFPPERDEWGYYAMVESGLPGADLQGEDEGRLNTLPEWKKWRTGRLAAEFRREREAEKSRIRDAFKTLTENGKEKVDLEGEMMRMRGDLNKSQVLKKKLK